MKQPAKNRLHALGGAHNNAMRGLATGNRGGKGVRQQTVETPAEIWDVTYKVWPEGGIVDVCASAQSIQISDPSMVISNRFYGEELTAWLGLPGKNALKLKWSSSPMYLNVPFGDLRAWFAHGKKYPGERIWLVPVRTHRKWWRAWRDSLDALVECDPLAFHGFKQKFPAPLLLGYTGERVGMFAEHAAKFGGYYERT
jgi:hypothetical protein